MGVRISIIIPVYNAEDYIFECVQSILEQTYRDIEIIIIDDGSVDRSLEILDQLSEKNSMIRVIHQENKGVSFARNIGIENAIGDYIIFADADDKYSKDAIATLMKYSQYDMVCGSYRQIEKDEIKEMIYKKEIFNSANMLDVERQVAHAPWGKLFKKEIIDKNNIKFPNEIPCGEDDIFLINYLTYAKDAIVISDLIYDYNLNNLQSAMHKYYPLLYKYLYMAYEAKKRYCLVRNEQLNLESDKKTYYNECFRHYISFNDFDNLKKAKNLFGIRNNMWLSIFAWKMCKLIKHF